MREYYKNIDKIISIQKWYRGCILRAKRLPNVMYSIQNFLKSNNIKFYKKNKDGRMNSYIDEKNVINLLVKKYKNRIKIPNIRMWYDILIFDYNYGWLPVNIKTTSTLTNDNIGNLSLCVHSYTNKELDYNTSYNNSKLSKILFSKLKNNHYNIKMKKDYYFIILNKYDSKDIIINSLKGLEVLTPNLNNLPFQVCWRKNRNFVYKNITSCILLFLECLQEPKSDWKETFLHNIKSIDNYYY